MNERITSQQVILHTRYGWSYATDADKTRLLPPPGKLTPAQRMLNDAAAAGLTIEVVFEGETDYTGTNPVEAWEAILDCTEPAEVLLTGPDIKRAWALVIHENEEDDLVDYHIASWIEDWWKTVEGEYQ